MLRISNLRKKVAVPPLLLLAAAAVFLLGAAWWIWFRRTTHVTLEDAFITFRYARNLALGKGFVYNEGQRVMGTTTPLLTMLLGLLGRVAGPEVIPRSATVLMSGSGLLAALLTIPILRRLGVSAFTAVLGMALFFASRLILLTSVGGMETPLVLFFMALSFYLLLRRRPAASLVVGALLTLTRIDGVVWFAIILAGATFQKKQLPWRGLLLAALVALPWFLFSFFYFDALLPHSVIAKRVIGPWASQPYLSLDRLRAFVLWYVEASGYRLNENMFFLWLALLFAGAVTLVARRAIGPAVLVLLAYPFLYGAFLFAGRAPTFTWYLVPPLWCAVLVATAGLQRFADLFRGSARGDGLAERLAPLALVLLFFWTQNAGFAQYHSQFQANEAHTRRAIGLWLQENTPPGSVIAMEAIGYQGYFSRRPVLDLAGLVSPAVVRIHEESDSNAGSFHRVLTTLQPDYLVLRSFEVEQNRHFHGGALFESEQQRDYFGNHYAEAARFLAPYPAVWGNQASVTVYRRVSP